MMQQARNLLLFRLTTKRSSSGSNTRGAAAISFAFSATTTKHASPFIRRSSNSTASSSSSSSSSSSRDTRLAGRRRFYKHVGTIPVEAPWKTPFDLPPPPSSSSSTTASSSSSTIDSPISAGVDDSQSASGVTLELPTMDELHDRLEPRNPSTTTAGRTMIDNENDGNWFGVTLDGKSLKTPLGKQLAVPSQLLAWAIAAEWNAQTTAIQPAQMPLMTLCCTAMDQVAAHPQFYVERVLQFLPTDTTCFWTDPSEDRVLHRKQQEACQDLHAYCENVLVGNGEQAATATTAISPALAVAMGASEGLLMTRARPDKDFGLPHAPTLYKNARRWVESLDAWHLCAMHSVASESKSFLIAMAAVLSSSSCTKNGSNPFCDLTKAVAASRVEEEFQIENWGLVEGGHDYDRLNCSIQIHAAQVLMSSIAVGGTK